VTDIPAGSLRQLCNLPIYIYSSFNRQGSKTFFILNMLMHRWLLHKWHDDLGKIDNENGVTFHFTCGNYFVEETLPMEEKTMKFRKVLAYRRDPQLDCSEDNSPLAKAIASLLDLEKSAEMEMLKKDLIAEIEALPECGGITADYKAKAVEEVVRLVNITEEEGVTEDRIPNVLAALEKSRNGKFSIIATESTPGTSDLVLFNNYPNPFNPTTRIAFSVPEACHVSLKVYDVTGREIAVLIDDYMNEGRHEVSWNGKDKAGRNVTSGVYFYRLKAGVKMLTKKMILTR